MFKGGIGSLFGRGCGFPCASGPGCAARSGLASVFTTIFVLDLNDLPFGALSSISILTIF